MTIKEIEKTKYIRIAATTALIGNLILAALKITVGITSGSSALIGDGMDSSTDVLICIVTLIVAGAMSKPADLEHPWGHGRLETIATVVLSFVMFTAGAQLIINSVSDLFSGGQRVPPSAIAMIVTIISIAGKAILAWSQYLLGKRADSAMIKANGKNMASDVLISLGVLVGLIISTLTGSAYADIIIAILIGFMIIKTSIGIFSDTLSELMDGCSDKEAYRVIVDAVNSVNGANSPHRARMRRVAGFWDIDFDINVDPKCTVLEAHRIASLVENEIKTRLDNVFDIMIHVEPLGDDSEEGYGLSEDEMYDK